MHHQHTLQSSTTLTSESQLNLDISRTGNSLESLSLSNPYGNAQTCLAPVKEEGFSTVQRAKKTVNFASLKSSKLGVKDGASVLASQTGFVSIPRRMDVNWRIPNLNGKSTTEQQTLGSQLRGPSAAAVSRVSQYRGVPQNTQFVSVYKDNDRYAPSPNLTVGNPNIPRLYRRDFFKPGLIIRAALHEEDFKAANSIMTAGNTVMTTGVTNDCTPKDGSGNTRNIYSKNRKMIVVACYARHYIALPLFTHNGRGLENKREEEYISVRDHRDRSPGFKELSMHGSLTTEYIHQGIRFFDRKSTAHITYPLSRKYDLAIIHEGNLEPAAIAHLVNLFNQYAPALPMAP